jgi:TolB-like protein
MAPEQRSGGPVTARADQFALALVACEMVTGQLPEGGDPGAVPRGWRAPLRRALAEDPSRRYLGPVELVEALSGRRARRARLGAAAVVALAGAAVVVALGRPWEAHPRRAADQRSIAVLPLANLGGSPDDAYFGEGLAEDILTQLSKVPGLRVISRTSSSAYRGTSRPPHEVAAELGVGTVLEGSVRRAGGRVRISVHLIDARTDQDLWAETYDRDAREVLDVQSDVASKVASALALQLTQADNARLRRGSTSNPEAYDYYLRGVSKSDQWWRRANLVAAEADLEQALQLDPGYALAHARLAYCLAHLAADHEVSDASLFERARREAARALELESSLGLPHLAEGVLQFSHLGGWNLDRALAEVQQAQELEPTALGHSLLGLYRLHRGIEEAGLREVELGLELDPLSDAGRVLVTTGYEMAGRWQDAVARTRALNPEPKATRRAWKALVRLDQVDPVERVFDPEVPAPQPVDDRIARAMVLALRGRRAEAQALVDEIAAAGGPKQASTYHHDTYELAAVEAQLGHLDQALDWLRKTVQGGMPSYLLISRDPLLDPLRSDPGFLRLVGELRPRWEKWKAEVR